MIKTRKLAYSSVALAAALIGSSATAQNATIYYSQPTIVSGQPVTNGTTLVEPVPVITPRPDSEPTIAVEPDGHTQYIPAPATTATEADASYLGVPQVQVSQHNDAISYVSGGIGSFEKKWFENATRDYSLKLTYADTTGHHLSGVDVTLANSKGQTVLTTVTEGPYLLVKAPAGTYSLTSRYEGQSKTQNVKLGSGTARTAISFTDLP